MGILHYGFIILWLLRNLKILVRFPLRTATVVRSASSTVIWIAIMTSTYPPLLDFNTEPHYRTKEDLHTYGASWVQLNRKRDNRKYCTDNTEGRHHLR